VCNLGCILLRSISLGDLAEISTIMRQDILKMSRLIQRHKKRNGRAMVDREIASTNVRCDVRSISKKDVCS